MATSERILVGAVGFDLVKDLLLTAAHLGRLRPGHRVPSVRRMAQLAHLDRTTVHRAYLRLAQEGLLTSRKCSGTFLAAGRPELGGAVAATRLLGLLDRCFDEADSLGLSPATFVRVASLVATDGLRGFPVAVAECNHEQIGLIARELEAALGVTTTPLDLRSPRAARGAVLRRVSAVVATNCHRDQVVDLAAQSGLPVSFVIQDPRFADAFVAHARRGPVLLIVRDPSFERGFRRLLAELGVPPETARRMSVVDAHDAVRALLDLPPGSAVYVSPLVGAVATPAVHRLCVPSAYLDQDVLRRTHVELAARAIEIGWARGAAAQSATLQGTVRAGRTNCPAPTATGGPPALG